MKQWKKQRFLAVATGIIVALCIFASCSNESSDSGDGTTATAQSSGAETPASQSDDGGETTTTQNATAQRTVFTSTDSTNGYFNINGGRYQTLTFFGTDAGGDVTFSNGAAADLSGTYSSTNTSRAAVQTGCSYLFTLNGVSHSYSATITAGDGIFVVEATTDGSTSNLYIGGGDESIPAGSSEDPFAGTKWYHYQSYIESRPDHYNFTFRDGYLRQNSAAGGALWLLAGDAAYTVCKTSNGGYKASWNSSPSTQQETSTTRGTRTTTHFFIFSLIISGAEATEGTEKLSIVQITVGTGWYASDSGTTITSNDNQNTTFYRPAP